MTVSEKEYPAVKSGAKWPPAGHMGEGAPEQLVMYLTAHLLVPARNIKNSISFEISYLKDDFVENKRKLWLLNFQTFTLGKEQGT